MALPGLRVCVLPHSWAGVRGRPYCSCSWISSGAWSSTASSCTPRTSRSARLPRPSPTSLWTWSPWPRWSWPATRYGRPSYPFLLAWFSLHFWLEASTYSLQGSREKQRPLEEIPNTTPTATLREARSLWVLTLPFCEHFSLPLCAPSILRTQPASFPCKGLRPILSKGWAGMQPSIVNTSSDHSAREE